MAEPNSYEEQRRRQVEENKRKLEELCLHRLSAAVKPMPVSSFPCLLHQAAEVAEGCRATSTDPAVRPRRQSSQAT
uniref:Uncharacterized protein n=1 Tax=Aegilops tauschii subsp. strangulata TaxID=200361 RepID=A0A453B169_AEGTS